MTINRSTTCSARSHRAGLTLIEVVAAIAILGTLLATAVLAKARHTHQLALAQRKLAAVPIADQLITDWWADPAGPPIDRSGAVEADPTVTWRTRLVPNDAAEQLHSRVLRVEILDTLPTTPASAEQTPPLITVDLVLPIPEPPLQPINPAGPATQSPTPRTHTGASP